jgi:thiamine-phosphate pyrophosphorylase
VEGDPLQHPLAGHIAEPDVPELDLAPDLVQLDGVGGVHLNSRNPQPPAGFDGLVSRSCHTLDEVAADRTSDYLFLSPIFDSISKEGYRSAFTPATLREAAARGLLGERVAALGGVRPELLPTLRDLGFGGAALLGCIWRDVSSAGLRETLQRIQQYNRP